jgi:hypothetical protein
VIEVLLEPDPAAGAYRSRAVVAPGGSLAARSVPGLTLDVALLFR